MAKNFRDVMTEKSDAEILQIVLGPEDDYQPQALDAAKHEFEKRAFTVDEILDAQDEIIRKRALRNAPLETHMKALCFLLPAVTGFFLLRIYDLEGYDRKRAELTQWSVLGFVFYTAIMLLSVLFLNFFTPKHALRPAPADNKTVRHASL